MVTTTTEKKKSDSSIQTFYINLARRQISHFALGKELCLTCRDLVEMQQVAGRAYVLLGVSELPVVQAVWITLPASCAYFADAATHASWDPQECLKFRGLARSTHLMISYLILPKGVILGKCENTLPSYINRCIVTETHFKYLRGFILLTYV